MPFLETKMDMFRKAGLLTRCLAADAFPAFQPVAQCLPLLATTYSSGTVRDFHPIPF